jgi:hypothetical protein
VADPMFSDQIPWQQYKEEKIVVSLTLYFHFVAIGEFVSRNCAQNIFSFGLIEIINRLICDPRLSRCTFGRGCRLIATK